MHEVPKAGVGRAGTHSGWRGRRRWRPGLDPLEGRQLLTGLIAEYPVPGLDQSYALGSIVPGPDGALWFTEPKANRIGRITTAGALTEFAIPTADSNPEGIAVGPDGALWFAESGTTKVGRITTAGVITEFPLPIFTGADGFKVFVHADGITAGPDGALWFADSGGRSEIGRITTSGVVTTFPVPNPTSGPLGITAGPDGNLWFTETYSGKIGRITTSGVVTEFQPPTPVSIPGGITAGPDGNLWFTEIRAGIIGRITTAGTITEFPIPALGAILRDITAGPDGNLWFTEDRARLGRITPAGVITEFPSSSQFGQARGITTGPDGNLWFTETSPNAVGKFAATTPTTPPTVVSVRRFGFHANPTTIVLAFGTPLDPAAAGDVRNYRVVGPGGKAVAVASAAYDPAANTVTLRPRARLDLHRLYQLTVTGTAPGGLSGATGVLLAGSGGVAGTDYVATLRASDLVLGSSVPGGPARLASLKKELAGIEASQAKQLAPKAHATAHPRAVVKPTHAPAQGHS